MAPIKTLRIGAGLLLASSLFLSANSLSLEKVHELTRFKDYLLEEPVNVADAISPLEFLSAPQSPNYTDTIYNFTNLKDHNDHSAGTYNQRYFFSSEFYKPGGPLLFFTPGEVRMNKYNKYLHQRLSAEVANATGAAIFVVEHRYFGYSLPTPDLSTASFLKYHSVNQTLQDFAYFMKNVQPPVVNGKNVTTKGAKWITIGGSWSGTVSAWLRQNYPDLVYASHATSAPVQAVNDFWTYFEPIRHGMPQNCSADVQKVINHVDSVITSGDKNKTQSLKAKFGLGNVTYDDDFAAALAYPVFGWQDIQALATYGTVSFPLYDFCDYMSSRTFNNSVTLKAPASGWDTQYALDRYSSWMVNLTANYTENGTYSQDSVYGTHCLDTEDCAVSNSTVAPNDSRPWLWFVCTELGWYQTGAPTGYPTLVSRYMNVQYNQNQCAIMFNTANYTVPKVPKVDGVNKAYGGWNVKNQDKLYYVNGEFDPWRSASVKSDFGAPYRLATNGTPESTVAGGIHCWDLYDADYEPARLRTVAASVVKAFKAWLGA